jgi:hypothetical protein
MTQSNCCGNECGAKLILRGVGSAIRPGRLLLAVFCLAVLVGGGHIWDAIVGDWIPVSSLEPGSVGVHPPQGNIAPFELTIRMLESALESIKMGVMQFSPSAVVHGTLSLVAGIPMALWAIGAHWFVLLFGIYALVVLSVSIGIQCRFEAIVVAEHEPPSMDRLIGESASMSGNFIGSWGTPFVIAGVLGVMIMLAGFVLLNIPVINLLGGIVWGVVMLLGLAMAITLLGLAVAGALLLPAVAVDGCSGPDAMHRAFCGATTRPLMWLWYVVLIVIGLGLGLVVVETVLSLTVALITGLGNAWVFNDVFAEVAMSHGGESTASWTTAVTASFVAFWMQLLLWLMAGWVLCYLAAATTRAWMMLRLRLNGIAKDDIWQPGLMPGTLAPVCRDTDACAAVDDACTKADADE